MRSAPSFTGAGSDMNVQDFAAQLQKAKANVKQQSEGNCIISSAFGEEGKAIQAIGDIKEFDPQSGEDTDDEAGGKEKTVKQKMAKRKTQQKKQKTKKKKTITGSALMRRSAQSAKNIKLGLRTRRRKPVKHWITERLSSQLSSPRHTTA